MVKRGPRAARLHDRILEPVIVVSMRGKTVSDRLPRLPGDAEDDECDRESDQRIGKLCSERNKCCAGDDSEGDESVGAGVVAVGDQCRAIEPVARS